MLKRAFPTLCVASICVLAASALAPCGEPAWAQSPFNCTDLTPPSGWPPGDSDFTAMSLTGAGAVYGTIGCAVGQPPSPVTHAGSWVGGAFTDLSGATSTSGLSADSATSIRRAP